MNAYETMNKNIPSIDDPRRCHISSKNQWTMFIIKTFEYFTQVHHHFDSLHYFKNENTDNDNIHII